MAAKLGQDSVPVMLDQAIYSKAKEIIWKHRAEFSRVALLLGGFHTTMVFLANICQQFADAGLQHVIIDSGIVGSSAITSVLPGKHYNRGIRTHQVVMEALFRLLWREFEKWLGQQHNLGGVLAPQLKKALDDF